MASDANERDWAAKVAFMRANVVESAKWDTNGFLVECRLGPAPLEPSNEPKHDIRPDRRALLTMQGARLVPRGE